MIEREAAIRGLKCRFENRPGKDCEHCHYGMMLGRRWGCDFVRMSGDALALLKAREPRVMTLEEVEALPYGHVLIETDKKDTLRWLDALLFCKNANFSFDFITLEGRARLLGTEYNREWRCWTSLPTDEQREAVKWE